MVRKRSDKIPRFESGERIPAAVLKSRRSEQGVVRYLAGSGYEAGATVQLTVSGSGPAAPAEYYLRDILSTGHKYIVYLAHSASYGEVVIKMPWPKELVSEQNAGRLQNEIRALQLLSHSGIQAIKAAGAIQPDSAGAVRVGGEKLPERPFMITEYIPGPSLLESVRSGGPLPRRRSTDLIKQLCEPVAYAHKNGVLHGDIKPNNFLGGGHGIFVLIDFELSEIEADQQAHTGSPLSHGLTVPFAAPELFERQPLTAAADQYSLAATIYFALSGSPTHPAQSSKELMKLKRRSPATPIASHRPELGSETSAALMKALECSPADRYRDVNGLRSALLASLY